MKKLILDIKYYWVTLNIYVIQKLIFVDEYITKLKNKRDEYIIKNMIKIKEAS